MQQKILNDRYELEQKIGEGGMARVYRGHDRRLNRRVAIKVLHPHYASDAGFLQRFHHEAQAAANLRHPNIVDVYDVGQDGDVHYIVMEYVEGSDLKNQLLHAGSLPIDQALSIAAAVADGLDAAHRLGMIHRDVKPQNIIIGPAGQVKITDFGIAKSRFSTATTETGVTFGTADYISPEQARGQPATPQSDIYSLAVTLYEMLAGRLPFSGDSSIAVAMQHVSTDPPPLRMFNPRIPPQIEALVLRALSKDPADRPATVSEFARLLRGYHDLGEQATVMHHVAPQATAVPRAVGRLSGRPAVSVATSPRAVLPPSRPSVIRQAPPSNRGLGFGGFILGVLLLAGVLGLLYLFLIGTFDDLFVFIPSRPVTTPLVEPSAVDPTAVPLVMVPNLVGMDEQTAHTALEQAKLGWRASEPRFNNTIAPGLVIDQFPSAQTMITETSIVTYSLSKGPEIIEVPNVVGYRSGDAQSELQRNGFNVHVVQEPSQTMTEDFVIRTEPQPGARPRRGETITIVVSAGNKSMMPDVTGKPEDEARRLIESAGLFVSYVDYQSCEKLGDLCNRFAPGVVVSSVPRGGETVQRGTGVTLGVRAP